MKSQKIRSTVSPLQSAYLTGAGCMASTSSESDSKLCAAIVFVEKIAKKIHIYTDTETQTRTKETQT